MKFSPILAVLLVLLSCNTDDINTKTHNDTASAEHHRIGSGSPTNTLNPYDYSGQLFGTLFDLYHVDNNLPTSTQGIVDRVELMGTINPNFLSLKTISYQAPSATKIDEILEYPSNYVEITLLSSSLSEKGRLYLRNFIETVVPLCSQSLDYEPVHDYISGFEDGILTDNALTSKDMEVILTTTSITRFSAYKARKKPKKRNDPDWDVLVTHITAGAEGADKGVCEAVSNALATGIAGQ